MKLKIIIIFIVILLIATSVLPAYGNINNKTQLIKKSTSSNDDLQDSTNNPAKSFQKVGAEEEWSWDYSQAVYSSHKNVLMTPLVVNLDNNMTNGSEIIFITYDNSYGDDGILRAIHGKDGSTYFDVTDINNRTSPSSTPAIGDIDNDGKPEIITIETRLSKGLISKHLIAFEHDGTWKWTSDSTNMLFYGAPAIADLDENGIPEIVIGDQVFDNSGKLLDTGGAGDAINHSIVANVDNLPGLEIIAGNTVYGYNPSISELYIKWENTSLDDGFNAVGFFDLDPEAEIVLVTEDTGPKKIYLLNHTMDTIWCRSLPEGSGGPPTIDDYDSDFLPEIGVATKAHFIVYDTDGNILWDSKITDDSSGRRGSTVYDLNCDGVKDVIYGDERNLTIFDGRNGVIQWITSASSLTAREYNVVADVDNDNHAEIIVPCTLGWYSPTSYGIRVFGNDTNWTCARKIWNQHSYHITNVYDDATIPKTEERTFWEYNNFRVQNVGNGTPKLCCSGETIHWYNVKPGTSVKSSFKVWNCGDPCSELDWNVTGWPSWGDWLFILGFGRNLKECSGPTTITVYCTAPNIPNWGGHGFINVSNREDPSNYCLIPVNLTTSKAKTTRLTILEYIDCHPILYPILRQLLGLQLHKSLIRLMVKCLESKII
jgi:hypothetical protein